VPTPVESTTVRNNVVTNANGLPITDTNGNTVTAVGTVVTGTDRNPLTDAGGLPLTLFGTGVVRTDGNGNPLTDSTGVLTRAVLPDAGSPITGAGGVTLTDAGGAPQTVGQNGQVVTNAQAVPVTDANGIAVTVPRTVAITGANGVPVTQPNQLPVTGAVVVETDAAGNPATDAGGAIATRVVTDPPGAPASSLPVATSGGSGTAGEPASSTNEVVGFLEQSFLDLRNWIWLIIIIVAVCCFCIIILLACLLIRRRRDARSRREQNRNMPIGSLYATDESLRFIAPPNNLSAPPTIKSPHGPSSPQPYFDDLGEPIALQRMESLVGNAPLPQPLFPPQAPAATMAPPPRPAVAPPPPAIALQQHYELAAEQGGAIDPAKIAFDSSGFPIVMS
jgi:hypothetical protein